MFLSQDRFVADVGACAEPLPAPDARNRRPLRIALAGYGVVGQALAAALRHDPDFEIVAILVRDPARPRDVPPLVPLTDDLQHFLSTAADIVIDVLSCARTGRTISAAALASDTHVVSASKRVISAHLSELQAKAKQSGARLLYSAAVGGAAPVLETVAEAARHGAVRQVRGVLNGTVNFILDRLHRGCSFDTALAAARAAGLAEEDPSEDLSGADAAAKLTLIAHAAWGRPTLSVTVECEALDRALAGRIAASGERWVQCAELDAPDGLIRARVRLCPVREAGGIPALRDAHNCARIVTCDGRTFGCEGRGAGGPATAEAILADLARIRSELGWRDIEAPLPEALRRFGAAATARIGGSEDGPLTVLLGGISANRFVADDGVDGPGWWAGLAGAGKTIDPATRRIIGFDFIACDDGRSAPSSEEQADALAAILAPLGKPATIVGASYGGMVALALVARRPELVDRLVVISAPHEPHPASTAVRELQRRIVALGREVGQGEAGLGIARGLAMLTYRTSEEFADRFRGGIATENPLETSDPGAYLRARGAAYPAIMSPGRFLSLSAAIDRHRIDPAAVRAPALVIGASSDTLVPPAQLEALAAALPDARLHILDSGYGHDMFLKEADRVGALIAEFLEQP
jgi:homoserine O-acetyltransferase/O-succinyltransferase